MLQIDKLDVGYKSSRIISGISFDVQARDSLIILGRNGVGKSTLLKGLIGLLKPTAGTIKLEGRKVQGLAPHAVARSGIAYVPQGRRIIPKLTVLENLMVGTTARPGSSEIPPQVFTYFPILKERLSQKGGTLSGGQQQQLAIARAMCAQPKVILLDEPSEGIQPNVVQQIGEILVQIIAETGTSVVLVEQNLNLAFRVGGDCAVIEKGRISYRGKIDEFHDQYLKKKFLAV